MIGAKFLVGMLEKRDSVEQLRLYRYSIRMLPVTYTVDAWWECHLTRAR